MSIAHVREPLMTILAELDLLDPGGALVPLDSMAKVLIATEIERRIVPVPDDELDEANFESLASMVMMVERLIREK